MLWVFVISYTFGKFNVYCQTKKSYPILNKQLRAIQTGFNKKNPLEISPLTACFIWHVLNVILTVTVLFIKYRFIKHDKY